MLETHATQKDTAEILNNLLEYLHDSRDGYLECAEEVDDTRLINLFRELARTREQMINHLQEQVIATTGKQPEESGSMTAAAHRLFIDLKSLITGGDSKAIINEIKRGEDTTIQRYREALNKQLPSQIKMLLTQQLTEIESNLFRIESYPVN